MKRGEIITKTISGEEKSYKFDVEFNYGSILSYPYVKAYYLCAYPMKQLGLNMVEDMEFEVKTLLFEIDKPDDTSLEFALRVADQYIDTSILQIEQKKIEKDRKISKNRDKIDKEVKGIGSYDYEFDFNVDEYLKDLGVEIDKDDFKNNKEGNDEGMGKFNGRGYKTNKDEDDDKRDSRLYGIEKCKYYVEPSNVTFDDIAGMKETKEEVLQAVDLFEHPEKYEKMGLKRKLNNIMLSGSSGCGKTLLAKAISNELGIPMFATSGDMADKYVGQSSRNIETLFKDAKKYSPSIIFIDEFEACAKQRSGSENNQEREAGVSTLLAQLDGMSTSDDVMVIVATNLPDSIDEAVRRRFPTKISVSNPDFETRRQILEINTKDTPLEENCDLSKIARNLSGFNGGDIAEIVSSAIMLAVKREKETVGQKELEDAMERVVCGLKSKTKKVNEEEKSIIAYHEISHSVCTYLLKKEKIQRISIIPTTGSTLGYVYYANEDDNDRFLQTKEEMLNSIIVALAGRCGEEIVFGKVTGGCSNDLEKATHIAETMVTKLGMTKETFGLMSINPNDIFMRERVVNEVNHILNDCYEKAKEILNENRELLDALAKRLIDKEEMNLEDFEEVLAEVENK